MSEKETYKNKKIEIKQDESGKKLYIDDKEIEVTLDNNSGTFSCSHLPYSRYSSLEELGKALIDN